MWAAVMALVSVPALNSIAQEGPGPGDEDEVEMMEGPGPGQPGMKGEMGPEKMMMKKKMMMREGKGPGGPGFMPEDEILATITKYDPAFAKKVTELRSIAPAKYKMIMQMSGKLFGMAKMQQDESIEKDAVRTLSLEYDTKELSLKYDKAPDADRKAIKDTLRGKLSELFDLKTKGQELRVKFMEKEIGRLKKNLESRKVNKAKIVEQRLEQMTGEGYGW